MNEDELNIGQHTELPSLADRVKAEFAECQCEDRIGASGRAPRHIRHGALVERIQSMELCLAMIRQTLLREP